MSGYYIEEGCSVTAKAKREGIGGTVTFRNPGPQWGAFHPGGDESIVVPIQKWDSTIEWVETCSVCGEDVWVTWGSLEVIGAYHSGCFGYPCCSCKVSHKGDCPIKEPISKGIAFVLPPDGAARWFVLPPDGAAR
jgi:hypothetical protein